MKKSRKWFVVVGVVMLMAFSITVSYMYWANNNIDGTQEDGDLNVIIGTGGAATTTLSLSNSTTLGELVPATLPANQVKTNQIQEAVFNVNVKWIPDVDPQNYVPGTAGTLTVKVKEILCDDDEIDASLFSVNMNGIYDSTDKSWSYNIVGESVATAIGTDVEITVTMAEPANKDQYLRVAGKDLKIVIGFEAVANASV